MKRRARRLPIGLLSASLLGGCASDRTIALDTALLPRDGPPTCASPRPGRAGLLVPEPMLSMLSEPLARQRLQIGRITGQALLMALDDCLAGGGQWVAESTARAGDRAATLTVVSLHYEHQDHLLWIVPLPWIPSIAQAELSARLDLELSLLDSQGRTVWTRSYSDDMGRLKHSTLEPQVLREGVPRLAHEAAWRLAQRAVRDLREWVDTQRLAPREL
jgi:hypothetical protein